MAADTRAGLVGELCKQGARFHSDIPPLPPLPSQAEVWCLTEIPRRGVALGANRLQKQSVNVCLAAATFYTLLKHSWRHSPDTRTAVGENRLPRGTDRRTHTLSSQQEHVSYRQARGHTHTYTLIGRDDMFVLV